ncbi:hypothetical protein N9Z11_02835, partial [Mariniblastus sp.]|nr:hypothetical protein [Mariniblastus sp.]
NRILFSGPVLTNEKRCQSTGFPALRRKRNPLAVVGNLLAGNRCPKVVIRMIERPQGFSLAQERSGFCEKRSGA